MKKFIKNNWFKIIVIALLLIIYINVNKALDYAKRTNDNAINAYNYASEASDNSLRAYRSCNNAESYYEEAQDDCEECERCGY